MTREGAPGPPGQSAATSELVTVVINFLDAEPFLAEAIDSVYAQTYPHWELVLVDDGSTDRSSAIARQAAADDPRRVRYLEHADHRNLGASAARNLGMSAARGELIAFLDADDVWRPTRLERSVALFRENAGVDLVYGKSEYWHSWAPGGKPADDRVQPHGFAANRVVRAPELLVMFLTHRTAVPCVNSLTVRRHAAVACGGWVEDFRGMYDDQAFLARLCRHGDVFVADECWDRYRQHGAGLCATAARSGQVAAAHVRYLAWLRVYLEREAVPPRLSAALRYAERAARHSRSGWYDRCARLVLRASVAIRMALLPADQTARAGGQSR